MATSIDFDVVAEVEKEINCPVCWEEFEEPKCLPSCAHNVCQHCLEGMVRKRKDAIQCPVCRVESIIPNDGVAAFPKNHLLVRLIERIPGRKEEKIIREAIKRCKEKVEGAKIAIKEMEDRFETANTLDEEMKQRIKSLVEDIVTKAREQEQKMLQQLQSRENGREKSFETLKSSCVELCENASSCIQTAERALQIGELDALGSIKVENLNDFTRSLDAWISEANSEFTQATNVSLTNTDLVEKLIYDQCLLGKTPGKRTFTALIHQDVGPGSGMLFCEPSPVVDFSRCGSLIKTIDDSYSNLAIFNPSSVAASRVCNHLVALDEESNLVYISHQVW